jgi:uroporphyrinogen-III decarboxylase
MINKEALYQARKTRVEKTLALEPVDRVPTVFMGMAFAPRFMGMSIADFCAIPENRTEVTLAAMDALGADDWDGINALPCGQIVPSLASSWLSRIAVPGRDLPEDELWQVHEAEIMLPEDYDTILKKGWPAFLESYMPRVIDPKELADSRAWVIENVEHVKNRCREHGYVPISFGGTSTPFEYLCGGRSMSRFFIDLYRDQKKLKEVMDHMLPYMIQEGIETAEMSGINCVWVGGWRSASSLVSPPIWEEFVFPYLYELVHALAEKDIVSLLHFDQDWTRDLSRLLELPKKMCLLNADGMTDLRKAREILDGHMAIMGDVPSSMLCSGTVQDVTEYVRDLIRDVGPTGLLVCPGCDAPINAKPENVRAMVEASREFGAN